MLPDPIWPPTSAPVASASAACRCRSLDERVPTMPTISNGPSRSAYSDLSANLSLACLRLPTHVNTLPASMEFRRQKPTIESTKSSPGCSLSTHNRTSEDANCDGSSSDGLPPPQNTVRQRIAVEAAIDGITNCFC